MSLKGKGEIYMLIAPNGKKYIGQTRCYGIKNSKLFKRGLQSRWRAHKWYAKTKRNTLLSHSINKYGAHNFIVKTILICDEKQMNYFETKYIRQYNTMVPDGLNMVTGGGVHHGEGNPMFGKTHSEETRQKIRETQVGKILPDSQKASMSKAHTENMTKGKLPPRRTHDLPKYIYHVTSKDKDGYEIRHHPTLKQKQFVAKILSMEDKLKQAEEYLLDTSEENKKEVLQYQVYESLPRYIRHVKAERFEGFEIKNHPTLKNKKWTNMKLSMNEKLQLAKDYLQ